MEVGPLARVMVAYQKGHAAVVKAVNDFLGKCGLTFDRMYSTLGRIAARAIETQVIAQAMEGWLSQLQAGGSVYQRWTMPASAAGYGLNEAPRGPWATGSKSKTAPSATTRCNPLHLELRPALRGRQARARRGRPVGTPVADPQRPIEILRTVHSFDPCIACAVHVIDPGQDRTYIVRTS